MSRSLLLQQDAAALAAVAESFDLSASDVQWLLSAPRGDGMLIARGGRFPVRVLATPEEHRLIDAVRGTGSFDDGDQTNQTRAPAGSEAVIDKRDQ